MTGKIGRPGVPGGAGGTAQAPRAPDGQRIAGPASGQLSRDIENYLSKINGPITTNHLLGLLLMMPQGSKAGFDKKTHRRIVQRTTRLAYIYLAAHLLGSKEPQAVTEDVLKHLQSAQQTIQRAWGAGEFAAHGRSPPA